MTPVPDPELRQSAHRRRFSAEYRMRIVREADACAEYGQIGALLRREGLYSSHLADWRRQRDQAALHELSERRRGPKPAHLAEVENARLRQQVARLERELAKAHTVIDVQGKVAALLGGLESAETHEP
jgi:transposase